jgi:hypothetical protein
MARFRIHYRVGSEAHKSEVDAPNPRTAGLELRKSLKPAIAIIDKIKAIR